MKARPDVPKPEPQAAADSTHVDPSGPKLENELRKTTLSDILESVEGQPEPKRVDSSLVTIEIRALPQTQQPGAATRSIAPLANLVEQASSHNHFDSSTEATLPALSVKKREAKHEAKCTARRESALRRECDEVEKSAYGSVLSTLFPAVHETGRAQLARAGIG